MSAVRVERSGPVFTVLLNRPAVRNAVDGPTAHTLTEVFREFDEDPTAAVAVLHGEGGTFCSGADLKALGTARSNDPASPSGSMGPTRLRLSKPVIAAVSGHAVAGGLEPALWCDLRVADSDAVFGVFCRRWGVPLIDGGTVPPAAPDRHVPFGSRVPGPGTGTGPPPLPLRPRPPPPLLTHPRVERSGPTCRTLRPPEFYIQDGRSLT